MKEIYLDFLFAKGFFVGTEDGGGKVETLVSLAHFFRIRIRFGRYLARKEMLQVARRNLGVYVPEPFYRGFPETARALLPEELLFDQMLHYAQTYGLGDTENPGHSVFEETIEREFFNENVEPRVFDVLTEAEAVDKLGEYVDLLLDSTRPLNEAQYQLVRGFLKDYAHRPASCPCKDTAVNLLLDTRDLHFAKFLSLPDVIRLTETMQYRFYGSTDVKKLNLCNRDRVLITETVNAIFRRGTADVQTCFEKKKIWNGLLHHIHYKPIDEESKAFVEAIRGKQNLSAYSTFEFLMRQGRTVEAAEALLEMKGGAAILRQLDYLLSRCKKDEVEQILDLARSKNKTVLIQLLLRYSRRSYGKRRVFKFAKYNRLRVHYETEAEAAKRRSHVPDRSLTLAYDRVRRYLEESCKGGLGKVYVDEKMKRIALPLQETASMSGVGVLPKGSRIPLEEGKKLRAFTYWERLDDIDLSALAMGDFEVEEEFSWRTMLEKQSSAITFSGDQTSGFFGGSEYFDISLDLFREKYPWCKYLVFCNNVFSDGFSFKECLCTAGFMFRDGQDSGEVYEPKTVKTAFRVNCNSSLICLYAIDLTRNEVIWINTALESTSRIAGAVDLSFLMDYLNMTEVINVYDFATILATEITDDPVEADVVFSDEDLELKEGAEQVRSADFEKMLSLMNR